MRETLEQMVARLNAFGYLPPIGEFKMAKQIRLKKGQEFNFKKTGGGSKYPWDEWFSGDLLLLERSDVGDDGELLPGGEKRDFEVDVDAMPAKLKTAARRRYKVVNISRRDADGNKLGNGLIIQARDMTQDERTAEDMKRAEEKEARKAAGAPEPADDEGAADGTTDQSAA